VSDPKSDTHSSGRNHRARGDPPRVDFESDTPSRGQTHPPVSDSKSDTSSCGYATGPFGTAAFAMRPARTAASARSCWTGTGVTSDVTTSAACTEPRWSSTASK